MRFAPDEWKTRYNMTVNVGIGSGNKDKQLQSVMNIIDIHKQLGGNGVTEENEYNALEKLVEFSGLGGVERYFTLDQKPPEPPPDPQQELIRAQIQLTAKQVQVAESEMETNRQEAIWKHEDEARKTTLQDQRERYKIELEHQRNVPGGLSVV